MKINKQHRISILGWPKLSFTSRGWPSVFGHQTQIFGHQSQFLVIKEKSITTAIENLGKISKIIVEMLDILTHQWMLIFSGFINFVSYILWIQKKYNIYRWFFKKICLKLMIKKVWFLSYQHRKVWSSTLNICLSLKQVLSASALLCFNTSLYYSSVKLQCFWTFVQFILINLSSSCTICLVCKIDFSRKIFL